MIKHMEARCWQSLVLMVLLSPLGVWNASPASANIYVPEARTVEMPGSGGSNNEGPSYTQRPSYGCNGNACVREATITPMPGPGKIVPMPLPAALVPWAQSVYWAPSTDSSEYGKRSLLLIDEYLAGQCARSGNRQYYCKTSLNSQQIDWVNRLGTVQLEQTHYRWGNGWYAR